MASDMSVCGKVRRGYLRTMSTVKKNVFSGNVGQMVKENPKYSLDGNRIPHFPCFEWKEKADESVIHGNHGPMQNTTYCTEEPAKAETEMQDAPLISRYYLDLECPNRLKDELKQFREYMKNYKTVPDLQKIRGMGFTVGVGSGTSELMIRFARLNRRMLIMDPLPVYKQFTIQRPRAHLERIREGAMSDFDHTHYPTYLIMRSKRNAELLQQCEPLVRRNGFHVTSSKGEHAIKNLASVFRAHDRLSEVTKYFSALKESVNSSLERKDLKTMFSMGMLFTPECVLTPLDNASLDKACEVAMAANAANRNINTNCNVSSQPISERVDMGFLTSTNDDPTTLDVMATLDEIALHVDINHKHESDTKFGPRLRMLPTQRLEKPIEPKGDDIWIYRGTISHPTLNNRLVNPDSSSPKKSTSFVQKCVTFNEDLNEVHTYPKRKAHSKVKTIVRNIVNKLFHL